MPAQLSAALEGWLRSNGAPALAPRPSLVDRAAGPFRLVIYMTRTLLQRLLQPTTSILAVVPLLLVALTLSFFSTEVWQTIGQLKGLPLVLTALLFVALAAAFTMRQARPDLDELCRFSNAADLEAALPPRFSRQLQTDAFRPDAAPPLRWRERRNLVAISVFGQVLTASVIGLAVFAFFVVLGFLAVDRASIASWIGAKPSVLFAGTVSGHEYVLTNQLLRVSAFLGVFTGFYFIVTSRSDPRFREHLAEGHERHVRTCLAVRHAAWQLSGRHA